MPDSQILLEGGNPYGSLEAIVEDDGRTVYLYVRHTSDEAWGLRALWVANRLPAPVEPDTVAMRQGIAPLMPQAGTRHPEGHGPIHSANLRLVWFEEGDGVALMQRDSVLAVLPPWAGPDCPGYASQAIGEAQFAWELAPALESLGPRIAHAERYSQWRQSAASWPQIRDRLMAHLEARMGSHIRYWAVDGGTYPPRAVAAFTPPSHRGLVVFSTIGMSAQAMPQVEMAFEDVSRHRCIELVAASRKEDMALAELLSEMMSMPWQDLTWLGDGHTYGWTQSVIGDDYPGKAFCLLQRQPPASLPVKGAVGETLHVPDLWGHTNAGRDPVNFLWAVPITAVEQDRAAASGSAIVLPQISAPGRGWVWRDSPGA